MWAIQYIEILIFYENVKYVSHECHLLMTFADSMDPDSIEQPKQKFKLMDKKNIDYTMHNKFSNFFCFAPFCAHLCAIWNNFNDESRILGKYHHEFTDAIL